MTDNKKPILPTLKKLGDPKVKKTFQKIEKVAAPIISENKNAVVKTGRGLFGVLNWGKKQNSPSQSPKKDLFEIKEKRGKIDPKSKAFMLWSFDKLNDRKFYEKLTKEIIYELEAIYDSGLMDKLMPNLQKKMKNGALTYGSPITDETRLRKEFIEEAIDLIGWRMLRKYAEENKRYKL